MDWPQIIFGAALVLVLLALSLGYGLRQVLTVLALRRRPRSPERDYEYARAWRRVVNSALTLLLGALLTGALVFLEGPAQRLAEARDAEPGGELTGEARAFARLYGWYWVATLLVLLAVVLMAGADLWATYLFVTRTRRRLDDDRRAMIARQASRLREGDPLP